MSESVTFISLLVRGLLSRIFRKRNSHGAATLLLPSRRGGQGICGAIAGLLAVTFPLAGLVLGGGLRGLTLFGAGSGVWMSTMAGAGLPNSHLEKFEKAVSPGELLMIDVPRDRFEEIKELAKRHHPEAELEWVDPDISLRSNPT